MSSSSQDSGIPSPADRVWAAISPALADQVTHIMDEVRQRTEAESTIRLKKTLIEKEAEFRERSEADERRVREETASRVREEVSRELKSAFAVELESCLSTRQGEWESVAREQGEAWRRERASLAAEVERWRVLCEFQRKVGEGASQLEMLRRFLRVAERFAEGVALYLQKPDGLALWSTGGEGALFPEGISAETIDPEWNFTPIAVRGKTVAAVCGAGVRDPEAVEILVEALKRAIENLGLRIRALGGAAESAPPTPAAAAAPAPAPDGEDSAPEAEARRLARVLVSGIKLTHESAVQEGRVKFDLYARLQREIEAGRETYRSRLAARPLSRDYYHEEIVRILADNNPVRLGREYPGPR